VGDLNSVENSEDLVD